MSSKIKSPLALSAALAGGLVLTGSAFAMQPLSSGYMASDSAVAEGSCGAEHKAAEAKKTADTGMKAEGGMKAEEGKCGVAKMDSDKDGKVSKAEFAAAHDNDDSKFASHDTNSDGFITADEMEAHMGGSGGAGKMMEEGKCGEGKCGASA
ncbi:EF-hand domain-containing protein [Lysobacter sp. 2RAF19]